MNRPMVARLLMAAGCVLALGTAACAPLRYDRGLRAGQAPFDKIIVQSLPRAAHASARILDVPESAYRYARTGVGSPRRNAPVIATRDQRVHGLVRDRIDNGTTVKRDTFIVTYRDKVEIPVFPLPATWARRDTAPNLSALNDARGIVENVRVLRSAAYFADSSDLVNNFSGEVIAKYWIVQAIQVVMPYELVDSLWMTRPQVVYVQLKHGDETPPACPPASWGVTVEDARCRILSDDYYNLGLPNPWISLLDTGAMGTHTIFASTPNRLLTNQNCVNASSCLKPPCPCDGPAAGDVDTEGHGTSSAGIIAGNDLLGTSMRGVTSARIDALQVYDVPSGSATASSPTLNVDAALRAFECGLSNLDRVIVCEMQETSAEYAAISRAANNAFDAGAIVIAAVGNTTSYPVAYPAQARKVIGVGAFDVQTNVDYVGQRSGTSDNRYKPDIQAPTSSKTAANGAASMPASTTATRYFDATSGATPYAAGAAALIWSWMRSSGYAVDPGNVYAQLILAGQKFGPYGGSAGAIADGAGHIELPDNGTTYWGKVALDPTRLEVAVPFYFAPGAASSFEAAVWWPAETDIDGYNVGNVSNIDLEIIRYCGGVAVAWSKSSAGCFERATFSGVVDPGIWWLRITASSLAGGSQTVYWAATVIP